MGLTYDYIAGCDTDFAGLDELHGVERPVVVAINVGRYGGAPPHYGGAGLALSVIVGIEHKAFGRLQIEMAVGVVDLAHGDSLFGLGRHGHVDRLLNPPEVVAEAGLQVVLLAMGCFKAYEKTAVLLYLAAGLRGGVEQRVGCHILEEVATVAAAVIHHVPLPHGDIVGRSGAYAYAPAIELRQERRRRGRLNLRGVHLLYAVLATGVGGIRAAAPVVDLEAAPERRA